MKSLLAFLFIFAASLVQAASFSNARVVRISATAYYIDIDYSGIDQPGTLYYDAASNPVAVHCSTRAVNLQGGITFESEVFNPFASACSNATSEFFWAVTIGSDTSAVQYNGSKTPTPSPTYTRTPTWSPTITRTVSLTHTFSPTITVTMTHTFSPTTSPTMTWTQTTSPTPTISQTKTFSPTISQTFTFSPTWTKTTTSTWSPTTSPTMTISQSPTWTPTASPTPTVTNVPAVSAERLRPYTETFRFADADFSGAAHGKLTTTAHVIYSIESVSFSYNSGTGLRDVPTFACPYWFMDKIFYSGLTEYAFSSFFSVYVSNIGGKNLAIRYFDISGTYVDSNVTTITYLSPE